jgi:hypothetical protein
MFIIKNELKIITILLSRVNHWAETAFLFQGITDAKIVKIRIIVIIGKTIDKVLVSGFNVKLDFKNLLN